METNYLKEQFRKDILKEVEEYIGYVYSDDTHFEDKLIVKEFDYSVSHVRCSYKEQKKNMTILICQTLSRSQARLLLRQTQ